MRRREDFSPETYASRIERLQQRLIDLMLIESRDADVQRLAHRLEKYWDDLLTVLEHPEVPPTNNLAERELWPAVIMRKVMQGNRSEQGARTQAILMSIFRTLKRRNLPLDKAILLALGESLRTGQLPPFASIG